MKSWPKPRLHASVSRKIRSVCDSLRIPSSRFRLHCVPQDASHGAAMRRFLAVISLVCLFVSAASAQQMNNVDRDRMRGMLKATSGDIQKYFYDPELKGLDWKKLTAET